MPTAGEIFVNGVNIKEFSEVEYRKMFSVVFQEVNIYATTILKNVIGTDTGKAARKRGIECLELVGLKDKIESMEKKYDTEMLKVIDENGTELSGGQNQKIAIARALYKDSSLVILDEPTSALDPLAEAEIYQHFNELVKEKTAIYISHRMSSSVFCDRIIVIDSGKVTDIDTHQNLMKRTSSLYYKLFMKQAENYQE